MGVTRSLISHPFEIMKVRAQLGVNASFQPFRGLHYSLISSGVERGIQFVFYDHFRKEGASNLAASLKSSALCTFVAIPYSYAIVNQSVLKQQVGFSKFSLMRTIPLEYTRSFAGSSIFLFTYNALSASMPLWVSAFGGTTAVWAVLFPIDNLRNHIISKKTLQLRNLYRGAHYPILRSIPSSIAGMWVYEKVKSWVANQ